MAILKLTVATLGFPGSRISEADLIDLKMFDPNFLDKNCKFYAHTCFGHLQSRTASAKLTLLFTHE